ncbi:MAG: Helix-turn-helix domain [candidate division NC10 bacterium]|jgi:predicted transcriptional regulator|nr:Helix-turn-helix domain [candidate division NC10 bacterium]
MTTQPFAMRRKRWRTEREMRQADLAKASGVSREYIARLELGQQDPTRGTMRKRAKALKAKGGVGGVGGDTRSR